MIKPIDLGPAAASMKQVVGGVPHDALGRPTPCAEFTVAALLDHCRTTVATLASAARRQAGDPPHAADAARLPADWAQRLDRELDGLVAAWRDPEALRGDTTAGGMTMPAAFHNLITVQEVVVHGWDLAVATDQLYRPDHDTLSALYAFLVDAVASAPGDGSGPFGPPIDVSGESPLLDRVLALTGRDPHWRSADPA